MKAKVKNKKPLISTPALVTMQWLTYVFWALTSIAAVYLMSVITEYLLGLDSEATTESIAYAVAAAFILLPIAFVLDIFFSRHEDNSKSSAFSVVKVVHSVIFAVVSIIALITAVFNIINMLLNSFSDKSIWVAVVASLTTFVGFGILFIRTTKPNLFTSLRAVYRFFVLAVIVLTSVFALIGPFSRAMETKQPRAMRDTLINITNSMQGYVASFGKLPASINDLANTAYYSQMSYSNAANKQQLLDYLASGQITYKPNIKPSEKENGYYKYYYELCGKFDSGLQTSSASGVVTHADYDTTLSFDNVPEGVNCFKMSVTSSAPKMME